MKQQHDRWQAFAGAGWLRSGGLCAIALLAVFVATTRAADDDDEKIPPLPKDVADIARKYSGVTEWKGFFDASDTGSWAKNKPNFSQLRQVETRTSGHFTLKLTSDSSQAKRGLFVWRGNNNEQCGEATGSGFDEWSTRDNIYDTSEEWRSEFGGTQPLSGVEFRINLREQRAGIHMGGNRQPLTKTKTGQMVTYLSSDNGQRRHGTQLINEVVQVDLWGPHIRTGKPIDRDYALREWAVVRNGPGVLTFVYGHTTATYDDDNRYNEPIYTDRSRITLFPVYDELELEVTIEGYAKWRPKGSIEKPKEPGNNLVARATLKSKTGKLKELPAVKRFKFELLDTSREPGVCLNWPLQAKDDDYDLRLASENGKLADSDQKLTITEEMRDEKGSPYAETKVNSYDFGGRATLQVTCELEDGRELMGLIKTDKGEEDLVRIPKMDGPDWIAEVWRKDKHVEKLPANDDNEKVAGQTNNGDGFTLYEEYRGWVEKGKHLEGDPLKKDFFVRNKIGADATGGIALFDQVSKLRTHAELRASEIIDLPMKYSEAESNAQGERIMNLNHRDGPHRVDQHAVIMINTSGFRSSGGGTIPVANGDKTNGALRPGKAYVIRVEERGRADGVFSKHQSTAKYNLSEREAAVAYDRGVAHELLHSVGVDHHGEGETVSMFYFQGAGDPMNTAHRPRFVERMPPPMSEYGKNQGGRPAVWSDFDRGPTVTLLWEDTGDDVAQSLSADFERELTAERKDPWVDRDGSEQAAKYPQYGKDALFWSEMSLYNSVSDGTTKLGWHDSDASTFNKHVTIGHLHEADSGNELCLMRYYFANAYPVDATEKAFYLVRPGKNPIGQELCKSPEGTGQNDRDHKPKSRFGDSAPGRGSCFSYVCPNDAIPPRKL